MNRKVLAVIIVLVMVASSFSSVYALSYTVVKGDTLWDLGIKYGVEWGEIAELNGVHDARKLQIGTVLEIPVPGEVAPEEPAPAPMPEPAEEPAPPVSEVIIEEPAEEAFMAYDVSIPNGSYQVPGIVTLPLGNGPFPAVVMLHGTGSEKDEAGGGYALTAPALAEAGIASIRIDFIGTGDSQVDYIEYNFSTAVSDANAAFQYMANLEAVDATRIGVMGWSQGGTIAMLAAADNRSFQSVVTWAGAPDMTIGGSEEEYETAKEDGFFLREFGWRSPLRVSLQWFEDVYNTDVLEVFGDSNAPVLAVNGSEDDVVVPANAALIVEASANPASRQLILEGADHTFNIFTGDMTAFDQLIDATVNWFDVTLQPAFTIEEVTVMNGRRAVPATVVMPVGNGPFPAVVMNHGHGGSRQENGGFGGVAEALAGRGIATIRMDFPGCGDSTEPFTENYLSNMISDSNASLAYLLENYPIDPQRLGIMGYSMGGRIALHIGSEDDQPYKAMGLLAPSADWGQEMMVSFLGGQEAFDQLYEEAQSEKGYADFTTQWGQVQQLSLNWFDEMIASRPLENIAGYDGAMLVIFGDQDNVVRAGVNQAVAEAYEAATVRVVPNADHGYGFYSDQPDVTAAVEDSLANFFFEALR
ncbi:alpha/beta fold hydrolase [Anoxynatronum buryatiense]|uniref:LysM domain-containing protein n=1 Tax=Anoxynatronum buryatiense TaxID=489973 RepID=A0AA45WXS6_9CLOT|nr:alpha/beta fold hydrolase [Anoxynatronum buryatiense]SMP63691.1 LysM domain-containing protein [Anoxynatronum buryatiense]